MKAVALVAVGALALTGCSSTKDKAAKFVDQGSDAFEAEGLSVADVDKNVQVRDSTVVRDANGTAAVVVLRNRGTRTLTGVPIALDVRDAKGASIWKNDTAGLAPSLIAVPVLAPGDATVWINDQVLPVAGTAKRVVARVGKAKPATGAVPKITVGAAELEGDPVDGVAARGELINASQVDQRDLVVYGVARKGGRVVAAGRGLIPRVKPGAKAPYAIFFIGDPRGATLDVTAPPTTLENPR